MPSHFVPSILLKASPYATKLGVLLFRAWTIYILAPIWAGRVFCPQMACPPNAPTFAETTHQPACRPQGTLPRGSGHPPALSTVILQLVPMAGPSTRIHNIDGLLRDLAKKPNSGLLITQLHDDFILIFLSLILTAHFKKSNHSESFRGNEFISSKNHDFANLPSMRNVTEPCYSGVF